MPECELCSHPTVPIRLHSRFYRCTECGLIHFSNAESVSYEADYFNKEYKNQYGKNYTEDEYAIRTSAKRRLQKFFQYTPQWENLLLEKKARVSLLEIGSAAGFFLEEASRCGFETQGWEISEQMSEYANTKGISTLTGDFYSLYEKNKNRHFNVIAAFYVIEHIHDAAKFWQNITSLLSDQGYIMLAVPSSFGPVYYFNLNDWELTHPKDHFYDYNLRSIKKAAQRNGLKCLYCGPEKLHPERFPMGGNIFTEKIVNYVQKRFAFSDTVFAILQKH